MARHGPQYIFEKMNIDHFLALVFGISFKNGIQGVRDKKTKNRRRTRGAQNREMMLIRFRTVSLKLSPFYSSHVPAYFPHHHPSTPSTTSSLKSPSPTHPNTHTCNQPIHPHPYVSSENPCMSTDEAKRSRFERSCGFNAGSSGHVERHFGSGRARATVSSCSSEADSNGHCSNMFLL